VKRFFRSAVPLVIFIALIVHFLLPRLPSLRGSAGLIARMSPLWVLAAIVAQALSYVANGSLLQCVVSLAGGRLRLLTSMAIELGAATVCLVAGGPLGFGAAIYKWTRARTTAESAALAAWLPGIFDTGALVVVALLSAIELLHANRLSRTTEIALIGVIAALVLMMAGALTLLARRDWLLAIARKLRREIDAETIEEAWTRIRGGGWRRASLRSLLTLTFDMTTLYFAFIAAQHSVTPGTLIAGYGVPILLGRASFLPGGIAVIEVAMAAVYTGLGIEPHIAIVAVLTYRLISFWIPTIVGIPVAVGLTSRA